MGRIGAFLLLAIALLPGESSRAESTNARIDRVVSLLLERPRTDELPPSARPSIEEIRGSLASEDPLERILGAAAAARLEPGAKELLPDILAALPEDCNPIRYWLAEAVRRLGPDAAAAAPILAKELHEHGDWSYRPAADYSPDGEMRDAANLNLTALLALGETGADAVRASLAGRSYVRPGVQDALGILEGRPWPPPEPEPPEPPGGNPPPMKPDLASLLAAAEDGSEEDSIDAFLHLAWLGPRAKDAAPRLFDLLDAEDRRIRAGAAEALGATGVGDPAWVSKLVPLLDEPGTRDGVIEVLGTIGPPAAPAREKLVAILLETENDVDPSIPHHGPRWDFTNPHVLLRAAAARALGRIGGPPEELVPPLLEAGGRGEVYYPPPAGILPYRGPPWLRRHRRHVDSREVCADAIAALGPAALPVVRESLQEGEPPVRAAAAVALAKFPPEKIGEAAIQAAADPAAEVRKESVRALVRAADEETLRALADLVADGDSGVRDAALGGMKGLGLAAEACAPALLPLLTGEDENVAYRAFEVLWETSGAAEEWLVPATAATLREHPNFIHSAGWRLDRFGDRAAGAAEAIAGAIPRCRKNDRRSGAIALTKIAPGHPAAAAAFRELAGDPSRELRQEALRAIWTAGISDPATVKVVGGLLDDPEPRIVAGAAALLAHLAPESSTALGILAAAAKKGGEDRELLRAHAATALAAAGRPGAAKLALSLLDAKDKKARELAVEAIGTIGGVEGAYQPLVDLLEREKEHGVRMRIYPALASTGAEGTERLFEIYRNTPGNHHLRPWIRGAIAKGGAHAVPKLREWLRSGHIETYYAAAVMLGEIGEPARVAIPDLVALAGSGKRQALGAAIDGLSNMGAPPEVVLPLLRRALPMGDLAPTSAGEALGRIGPVVGPIVPDIARAVPGSRSLFLGHLLDALVGVGEDARPALPYLMASIPGARATDREALVKCLGRLGAHFEEVRPALLYSLDDPWPGTRTAAASALVGSFPHDPGSVSRVGRLLTDPGADVRRKVADLLGRIGADALPAVPDLVTAAETAVRDVSRASLEALLGIPAAADVVSLRLIAMARGDDPWKAHDALVALGRLGGPGRELLPAFRLAAARWDWRRQAGAAAGLAAWTVRPPAAEKLRERLADSASLPVRRAARTSPSGG